MTLSGPCALSHQCSAEPASFNSDPYAATTCTASATAITVLGHTPITCVRAWMLVLISPLATWEIIKLIVDAVLLCMSSKCGETARILESRAKGKKKISLWYKTSQVSWNYAVLH